MRYKTANAIVATRKRLTTIVSNIGINFETVFDSDGGLDGSIIINDQ
jgi:hypothetical protein